MMTLTPHWNRSGRGLDRGAVFIGHFAVGFAAKRVAPRASLGILMAAPLLLDLLWPIFLLLGWESVRIVPGLTAVTPLDLHDYPYSHSLLMAIVWSALLGLGYLFVARDRRAALVIGLGVFSHWVLDFVVHQPDLPLYPGSNIYLGLGLWNSVAWTLILECSLFAVGVWLYVSATGPRNRLGSIALYAMIASLLVFYFASMFGPPPPNPKALAIGTLFLWLFAPWAWWIDRNRELSRSTDSETAS